MLKNLSKSRKTSLIDPKQLLVQIYESEENYKQITDYMHKFYKHDFNFPENMLEQSRFDQLGEVLKKSANILKTMDIDFVSKLPPSPFLYHVPHIAGGVGLIAALPIINLSGSEEQKQMWVSRISTGEIITAYAQTELAHGSDVQNLQTTAVYNEFDQTFTVNTNSIGSYKFWPGGLGKFCNYVLVMARIFSKGKYRG